ncbi:MAG: hypothetical protein WCK39_08265 [Methanomassiliicoccales archaeon]
MSIDPNLGPRRYYGNETLSDAKRAEMEASMRNRGPPPKSDPKGRKRDFIITTVVAVVAVAFIALFFSGFFGPQHDITAVRQTTITTVHDASGVHVETWTAEISGVAGNRPASWGIEITREYTATNGSLTITGINSGTPGFTLMRMQVPLPITMENGTSRALIMKFQGPEGNWTGSFEYVVLMVEYRNGSAENA